MAVLLSVATTSLSPPPTPPARFGKSYGWQFRAASWKPGALAPDYLDGTLAADGADHARCPCTSLSVEASPYAHP